MARILHCDADFDDLVGTPLSTALAAVEQYGVTATATVALPTGVAEFGADDGTRVPGVSPAPRAHGRASWFSHVDIAGGIPPIVGTATGVIVAPGAPVSLSNGLTWRWHIYRSSADGLPSIICSTLVTDLTALFITASNSSINLSTTIIGPVVAGPFPADEWISCQLHMTPSGAATPEATLTLSSSQGVSSATVAPVGLGNILTDANFGIEVATAAPTIRLWWDDLIMDDDVIHIPSTAHLELLTPDTKLSGNWNPVGGPEPGVLKDGDPATLMQASGGLFTPTYDSRWDITDDIIDPDADIVQAVSINAQADATTALIAPIQIGWRDAVTGMSQMVSLPVSLSPLRSLNALFIDETLEGAPVALTAGYVDGPLSFRALRTASLISGDSDLIELWGYAELQEPCEAADRTLHIDADYDQHTQPEARLGVLDDPLGMYGVHVAVVLDLLDLGAEFGVTGADVPPRIHGIGSWVASVPASVLELGVVQAAGQAIDVNNPVDLTNGFTIRWWMRKETATEGSNTALMVLEEAGVPIVSVQTEGAASSGAIGLSQTPAGATTGAIPWPVGEWVNCQLTIDPSVPEARLEVITSLGFSSVTLALALVPVQLDSLLFGVVEVLLPGNNNRLIYFDDLIGNNSTEPIPPDIHLELLLPNATVSSNWGATGGTQPTVIRDGLAGPGVLIVGDTNIITGLDAFNDEGVYDIADNEILDPPPTRVLATSIHTQAYTFLGVPEPDVLHIGYEDQNTTGELLATVLATLPLGVRVRFLNVGFWCQTPQAEEMTVDYVNTVLGILAARRGATLAQQTTVSELWGYAEVLQVQEFNELITPGGGLMLPVAATAGRQGAVITPGGGIVNPVTYTVLKFAQAVAQTIGGGLVIPVTGVSRRRGESFAVTVGGGLVGPVTNIAGRLAEVLAAGGGMAALVLPDPRFCPPGTVPEPRICPPDPIPDARSCPPPIIPI